uniref:Activity-dependent neuroprotector homeobox protein-like n=1 Tax=Gouania willdenowi TaxID=441366 RepID=A0A8C5D4R7_GOUWI
MYQLPVYNLARIRKARKQVKRALGDIGLDFCKEAFEDFKEFCPDEQFVKNTYCLDICGWDPSYSKSQVIAFLISILRDMVAQTAIGYLKPLALKGKPTSPATQVRV